MIQNNGGEYGKYIIQDLHDPQVGTPEFREMYKRFSNRILWVDDSVCPGAFQMNTAWYYAVPEKDPVFEEHSHDSDELIGFIGSDPDDPYNLNAEIVVSINGEDHLLTKSSIIFVPAGLPHARISIKRVDRPVFHFSVVTSRSYDNGAYGK
ncbi:MAG: hypothetical protein PUA57_06085 [Eggerthellales bacterium]|nr:hypothetical protein [Eggerthellales bacterium]MDO4502747.1 hypothetical protein [Coriobacteriia bacterium]